MGHSLPNFVAQGEVAMSIRLLLAIVTGAIFAFALNLGLSLHHLNDAKASTSHAVQIHLPE